MGLLAVVYYRVSTKRQAKSKLGIDTQHVNVDRLLLFRPMIVAREYFEAEGGCRDNMPVLLNALRYCRRTGAILIIAKIDRLARKALFVADLINRGVTIMATDKPHADHLELLEDAIKAEKEDKRIRKRTKEALAAAKRRGVALGKACKMLALKNKQAAYEFAEK